MEASNISENDINGAADMFACMVQDQTAELHEIDPDAIDHGEIMKYILKTDLPRIYCQVTSDAILAASVSKRPPPIELDKLLHLIESQSFNDMELYLKQHSYNCFYAKQVILDWNTAIGLFKQYSTKDNEWNHTTNQNILKSNFSLFGERVIGVLHVWRNPHQSSPNNLQWQATCWIFSDDYNFSVEELKKLDCCKQHDVVDSDIISLFSSWNVEKSSSTITFELEEIFKKYPNYKSFIPYASGLSVGRKLNTYQTTVIIF